ncbi:PorV/PorQ family protein [bacterium]
MKKIIIVSVITLVINGLVFAGSGGRNMAEFLKLGVNARPVAMGEAFAAVADDVHAIAWNPAGLAQVEERQASFSHLGYVALIDYENLQYAGPFKNGTIAGDIKFLHTKDERRDATGKKLGSFTNYSSALTVGYAQPLIEDEVYHGLNLKIIHIKLGSESGESVAIDYGLLWLASEKIKTGLVLQNLGLKMKIADDKASLPLNLKMGMSYQALEKLIVATDVNIPLPGEYSVSLGSEYIAADFLKVRAGYKLREEENKLGGADGLTTGFGFNMKNYNVDYAYVPFGEYEGTHRVTLRVNF